ncbi:MAG: hypothetical protein QHH15_07925, partial [Candidatus Thermoplasmatota archaeon]|nr:hypothetical protein [Candidatus Thermoplasmatota archaeon]
MNNSVTIQKQKTNSKKIIEATLKNLIEFLKRDLKRTVDYVEVQNIPVEVIIPGRRAQVDPNREYILQIGRMLREL